MVSDTQTMSSAHSTEHSAPIFTLVIGALFTLCSVSSTARAQDPRDTTKIAPVQPPTPPTGTPGTPGIRLRLGRDTLPLTLPSVFSLGDREAFRQAQAQIEAARATAFQQNMRAILEAVPEPEGPALPTAAGAETEFEAEHMTYRPEGQGFDVERITEGVFQVRGRGIELLVRRHDLDNPEALAYLEQRLGEIGVIAALRSAGFDAGDEVRIGELAFELDPGG